MNLGSLEYLGTIWLISAVLMCVTVGVSRNMYRIQGIGSWLVLAAIGSLGGLASMPIVAIASAGTDYALPLMAIGFLASVPVIHWAVPAIAPDFQTQGFGATLLLAFEVGLAVLVAAYLFGGVDALLPFSVLQGPGPLPTE